MGFVDPKLVSQRPIVVEERSKKVVIPKDKFRRLGSAELLDEEDDTRFGEYARNPKTYVHEPLEDIRAKYAELPAVQSQKRVFALLDHILYLEEILNSVGAEYVKW